jgi:hypothetical protein
MQILHEGSEATIELRENLATGFEILAVPVPAVETDGNDANARFHESSREEKLLRAFRAAIVTALHRPTAVAVARLRVLRIEVQRGGELV